MSVPAAGRGRGGGGTDGVSHGSQGWHRRRQALSLPLFPSPSVRGGTWRPWPPPGKPRSPSSKRVSQKGRPCRCLGSREHRGAAWWSSQPGFGELRCLFQHPQGLAFALQGLPEREATGGLGGEGTGRQAFLLEGSRCSETDMERTGRFWKCKSSDIGHGGDRGQGWRLGPLCVEILRSGLQATDAVRAELSRFE